MSANGTVEIVGLDEDVGELTSPDIVRLFVQETDPADGAYTITDGEDVWVDSTDMV